MLWEIGGQARPYLLLCEFRQAGELLAKRPARWMELVAFLRHVAAPSLGLNGMRDVLPVWCLSGSPLGSGSGGNATPNASIFFTSSASPCARIALTSVTPLDCLKMAVRASLRNVEVGNLHAPAGVSVFARDQAGEGGFTDSPYPSGNASERRPRVADYDAQRAQLRYAWSVHRRALSFGGRFNPRKLKSLSGDLGQQLVVTEMKLAIYFAKFFKVYSFAYHGMGTGTRREVFGGLVTKAVPRVVDHSEFKRLMFR
jgi:hypothetical protein